MQMQTINGTRGGRGARCVKSANARAEAWLLSKGGADFWIRSDFMDREEGTGTEGQGYSRRVAVTRGGVLCCTAAQSSTAQRITKCSDPNQGMQHAGQADRARPPLVTTLKRSLRPFPSLSSSSSSPDRSHHQQQQQQVQKWGSP